MTVESTGNPSTWEALADYYSSKGWKADRSVLRVLNAARSNAATKAVTVAIRVVYVPWLEKVALFTQALASTYPTHGPKTCRTLPVEEGTVYLFADGLRMDIARSLEEKLLTSGALVETVFNFDWAALPTVTATAKPAWRPLADKLGGPLEGTKFEAKEKANGKALTHSRFKQLMEEVGIAFVDPSELGSASGCAWTEHGSVDTYGHDQGAKLAWRIDEELAGIEQRIVELLKAGWAKVEVVTDHGWLMVPGGLPKIELPKHLTASRWSRCAIPGPVPTRFSNDIVVLGFGRSCRPGARHHVFCGRNGICSRRAYRARGPSSFSSDYWQARGSTKPVVLKEMKWSGLRLNLVMDGAQGLMVDIRRKVADSGSSFARTRCPPQEMDRRLASWSRMIPPWAAKPILLSLMRPARWYSNMRS